MALLSLLGLSVLIISLGTLSIYIAYSQIAGNLTPRLEALKTHQSFQSSRIYDRNGTLLYEFIGEGRRYPITLDQVSPHLINATIAIEDASFYENTGVDYMGIVRAFVQNATEQSEISGASTISQQVIKNVVLTPEERRYERRYERKLKEIILAQELNRTYNKEQILELYLNEIPYGNLAYGIQAASKTYFGVKANELTLAQASLLAGLPQSPTLYNPIQYVNAERLLKGIQIGPDWLDPTYISPAGTPLPKARQLDVLRQMVNEGYLTAPEALKIAGEDLQFASQKVSLLAPHFVFYVRDYLEQKYGARAVTEGGLKVYTTLDLELQRIAQEEAHRRIRELELEQRNIHNAAVVVLQPNSGQILAMVGSIGYSMTLETTTPGEEGNVLDGNVNVTTAQRQPGSSLKPFNYLNGLEQNILYAQGKSQYPGITPGTIIYDVDTRFPVAVDAQQHSMNDCVDDTPTWYCPKNYTGKWYGPMRMHMALANSLNMPAVKVLKRSGVENFIDLLHRAGVASTSLTRGLDFYGLSLTLGGGEVTPLDLATAYNTLASGGRYFAPTPILKITDNSGTVLEEFTPVPMSNTPSLDTSSCVPPSPEAYLDGERLEPGTQCIDPRLVYIITKVISDDKARFPMFGPNNILSLSRPSAAKTGTTEDWRDAWASGFTRYVTISVWTGNNNNERTAQVESTYGGGYILHRVMERIWSNQRLMQILGEPFDGRAPDGFPDEFPGVGRKRVCHIGGNFNGTDEEYFVPEFRRVDGMVDGTTEVVVGKVRALPSSCDPSPPYNPKEAKSGVLNTDWLFNERGATLTHPDVTGAAETPSVQPEGTATEQPQPSATPPPPPTAKQPPTPLPTEQPQPTAKQPPPPLPKQPMPTHTRPPQPESGGPRMPNLEYYGENQAKEILRSLGITNVVVDYQGREKLGELYDNYPPYAVVSTLPAPGSLLTPNITVVLGVRAPDS